MMGVMESYGQYCPVAVGSEVIGDRWTPLIVRELFIGSTRFNDIQRGIPKISRTLLAQRLRRLERMGILERRVEDGIPRYLLTPAGKELGEVVWGLGEWAVRWSFGDPEPDQIDPPLLMWRIRQRVRLDEVPARRTTIQFDFAPPHRFRSWLVLDRSDATVCTQDPGYDVDIWIRADAGELERVWAGRTTLDDAVTAGRITVEGLSGGLRSFKRWFAWSPYHDAVVAAMRQR
jgi:DNA-binding HxlR family transcriptional regulator